MQKNESHFMFGTYFSLAGFNVDQILSECVRVINMQTDIISPPNVLFIH